MEKILEEEIIRTKKRLLIAQMNLEIYKNSKDIWSINYNHERIFVDNITDLITSLKEMFNVPIESIGTIYNLTVIKIR